MRHVRHISTVTDPDTGKVYPIPAGGSGEEAGAEGGGTSEEGGNGEGDHEDEGESGKDRRDFSELNADEKYEAMKRVNRDLEKKLKKSVPVEKVNELEAAVAKLEGREKEWEAEQAEREKEQKYIANANEKIVRLHVETAAKGVLHNPEVAFKLLDLSSFEVDDDGKVDRKAINKALEDLIKEEPYLAVQDGRRFKGSADGGARNGSTKPSQLTQADLAGMSPEQMVKAEDDGELDDLLGRSD